MEGQDLHAIVSAQHTHCARAQTCAQTFTRSTAYSPSLPPSLPRFLVSSLALALARSLSPLSFPPLPASFRKRTRARTHTHTPARRSGQQHAFDGGW